MRPARDTVKDILTLKHHVESIEMALAIGDFKHGIYCTKQLRAAAIRVQKDFEKTNKAIKARKKE